MSEFLSKRFNATTVTRESKDSYLLSYNKQAADFSAPHSLASQAEAWDVSVWKPRGPGAGGSRHNLGLYRMTPDNFDSTVIGDV